MIDLPPVPLPLVDAVVVVHGRFELARATLESLAKSVDVDTRVVVVDNASPDGAGERLADEVRGAEIVLHPDNVGFGSGANLGATRGSAPYLCILNSDLSFTEGWLGTLVAALEQDESAGAAAPLYLGPDGAVVDAGVLLGADGRGYAYGQGLASSHPGVHLRRRIDFGTAAALLMRREAFEAAGGFDPVYGLGYFEDADLGFALQRLGYHSLYEPAAVVTHTLGGSFTSALRERQLRRNRPIFARRYRDELAPRPRISRPPFDPHRELVLRDWLTRERLLVVDSAGELAGLATKLREGHPDRLVTCASASATPAPPADAQVEWLPGSDLPRVVEDRRFHYDAVVASTLLPGDVERYVAASQPQARRCRADADHPEVDLEQALGLEPRRS